MKLVNQKFEIVDKLNGIEVLKKLELIGRVAYKSEDLITEESCLTFIKGIIKRGHESVIEHVSVTAKIITDRGVSHEIVRHRIASYTQECVSGDSEILPNLTIKQLYLSKQKTYIKSTTTDNRIIKNEVIEVFSKGIQPVYQVKTRLGYTIKCTLEHQFLSNGIYTKLKDLFINSEVMVIGTKIIPDRITSIEYIKEDEVFDIEMKQPYHNYIVNGFVTHNSTRFCNYSKGKFNNGVTFIQPFDFPIDQLDIDLLYMIEVHYLNGLKQGIRTPQQARYFLPNGLKTELFMTANLREWRHFFKLRTAQGAHPQMRALAKDGLEQFQKLIPIIFEDI